MIWITRTQPGADILGRSLVSAGFEVWVEPVLEVAEIRPPVVKGNPDEPPHVVVVLSAHAARVYVGNEYAGMAAAHMHVAIGVSTANVLESRGFRCVVPETSTSEGVLEVPILKDLGEGSQVWVVAGSGGRELVPDTLRTQGCKVVEFEFYERQEREVDDIAVDEISSIVVGSGEGLNCALRQWRGAGGRKDVEWIVPSARVEKSALEFGLVNVVNAGGASTEDVAAILRQGNR